MPSIDFAPLAKQIASTQACRRRGMVTAIGTTTLNVGGLSRVAHVGDKVRIEPNGGKTCGGEVIRVGGDSLVVMPYENTGSLILGSHVYMAETAEFSPDVSWIGRVVDPFGNPLDGRPLTRGETEQPLRTKPPLANLRRQWGERLETRLAVLNTFLPLVRGQRIGLFAGSGVGKTTLLGQIAQGVEADVIVIALVGERGRELRDFVENVLGPEGMAHTILVVATSDQSPLIKRRAAWAAMSIAEHFRDNGMHTLLLVDSITRFAEAHREVVSAAGETGSVRGFPASTAHVIAELCERAGPGLGSSGDITGVFSVLVAASDMDEPIADITRGVLDGHIVLSREIAERGRFPAIDVARSVSRALPSAATQAENETLTKARALIAVYEQAELVVRSGLYAHGADPKLDEALRCWPLLDGFLEDVGAQSIEESFAALRKCLDVDLLSEG